MLEQYVEDHPTFAKYVVDNMPKKAMEFGAVNIPLFFKKIGYNLEYFAEYLTSDYPKLVEQAEKLLKKSGKFLKYAKGVVEQFRV